MALASRFEDLRVWQLARQLTREVYQVVRGRRFQRDFALSDQIRRAAVSTMNNIAEGFDSASRVEFARFLLYASRSASEVQSCLYVALDQGYVDQEGFAELHARAAMVRKLSAALIRSLKTQSDSRRSQTAVIEEPPPPRYSWRHSVYRRGSLASEGEQNPPVTGHRSPVTPFGWVA